jgi:hypothetical protein
MTTNVDYYKDTRLVLPSLQYYLTGCIVISKSIVPMFGPALGCGTRVRILGFADDFIIVAETKEELQQLTDQAEVWCQTVDMEIGYPKTKVMVFKGNVMSREPIWMCRGVLLEVVSMYKYLGIEFGQDHGIDGTYEHLASRLWAAWATLSKQYVNLKARQRLVYNMMFTKHVSHLREHMRANCGGVETPHQDDLRRKGPTSLRLN